MLSGCAARQHLTETQAVRASAQATSSDAAAGSCMLRLPRRTSDSQAPSSAAGRKSYVCRHSAVAAARSAALRRVACLQPSPGQLQLARDNLRRSA